MRDQSNIRLKFNGWFKRRVLHVSNLQFLYILPTTPQLCAAWHERGKLVGIFGGNCSGKYERKAVEEASMCGSYFAQIVQRSYAKPITFQPSSENRSLLLKPAVYESNMATVENNSVCVVRTCLQQRIRLTGLTCRTVLFVWDALLNLKKSKPWVGRQDEM